MPYYFSNKSAKNLDTCDRRLQRLFIEVIRHVDCTIIEGHRGEERQNELAMAPSKATQVRWPNSKHNSTPSLAVDVAIYPIDWQDRERQSLFAGYVIGVARGMGMELRWGGDWDRDFYVHDNKFDDLVHFELYEEPEKEA